MKFVSPGSHVRQHLKLLCLLAWLAGPCAAWASKQRGKVIYNGLPVPGATITASHGGKSVSTVSDENGAYTFPNLADGQWNLKLTMTGFAAVARDVSVTAQASPTVWELKMLSTAEILAEAKNSKVAPLPAAPVEADTKKKDEAAAQPAEKPHSEEDSADGLLVNGSQNNAATSQSSIDPAFGNGRTGSKGLYSASLALILDNSALDARPYSLSGLATPKSSYTHVTSVATFGGPLNIPHLMRHGPNLFVIYQWTRDRNAITDSGLVPTLAERSGILPTGNVTVSPQAQALLAFYPLPNITGNAMYNYQVPLINNLHRDILQLRLDKNVSRRDNVYGSFDSQSTRADNVSLFAFRDTTDTLGINGKINWNHHFNHNIYANTGFSYSRLRTQITPFFDNRTNVSGAAGISGNDQSPANWGPPALIFSSGIASLSDAQSAFDRNQTEAVSESVEWYRGNHNFKAGGDFRREEFNYFAQQDPRGTFTFSGAATGTSDFADFLAGTPDTSSIAFGNPDKYLRQSVYDAYLTDDWRLRPELTLNIGLRWEYGAPITELKGRLVNLDVTQNFAAVAPVLASSPVGPLTGRRYPTSLLRPDYRGIEPHLGLSWRPFAGSSVVVRGGYGIYDDTSVYQATALALAQQAPLSKSLSVQNNPACPLSLANGFLPCAAFTPDTFAVDPNFRVGYAQTWRLAVQRDLPAALQMVVTYLGIKGSNGVQEFLPNTYPLGAANPCPQCPTGFIYRGSNGTSLRNAGTLQLRRRLRSGLTATIEYTYSKSIDDDSVLGGQGPVTTGATSQSTASATIAQNWLDLRAERSLSSFDQRHLITAAVQYTTGMGLGGNTLLGGWRGRILKEWTIAADLSAGSGLPETPVFLAPVNGTGFSGSIRPDRTSAPLYSVSSGHFLNAAAFAAPAPGQWGNAGRNSIIGPGTFTFNTSFSRTFRISKRLNLDVRLNSENLLNHAVFTQYNTVINPAPSAVLSAATNKVNSSPLFGLPVAAGAMRSQQITARLRF